ncbi:hypothetical protein LguiB_019032 [Lonicera macranthoides]
MASQNPNPNPNPRTPKTYPHVIVQNQDSSSKSSPIFGNHKSFSHSSMYPTIDKQDLFPNKDDNPYSPSAPPISLEEIILTVPGAILHLIDKHYSIELACGDLSIIRLRQGENTVAILASVADEIRWPLAKDEAAVKLDTSHYFFTIRAPKESGSDSSDDDEPAKGTKIKSESAKDSDLLLNYGLTIASKGQDKLLEELDGILEIYSGFSVQKVDGKGEGKESEVLDGSVAKEFSPADLKSEKKEVMEDRCRAYWTTLAPNVEDYSGLSAKLIAAGSGQLVKGILWCGDVTMDRLKWGNEVLKNRMDPAEKSKISPDTMKRIQRVKKVTKMTEKVATGVLSGVVKVSGFFTSSVANSRMGKKFFGLLPGEVVLASLDGFNKVCDAVEIAGKNVMSTSSTVTTGLVNHRKASVLARKRITSLLKKVETLDDMPVRVSVWSGR